jgi:hypothetical protein
MNKKFIFFLKQKRPEELNLIGMVKNPTGIFMALMLLVMVCTKFMPNMGKIVSFAKRRRIKKANYNSILYLNYADTIQQKYFSSPQNIII